MSNILCFKFLFKSKILFNSSKTNFESNDCMCKRNKIKYLITLSLFCMTYFKKLYFDDLTVFITIFYLKVIKFEEHHAQQNIFYRYVRKRAVVIGRLVVWKKKVVT